MYFNRTKNQEKTFSTIFAQNYLHHEHLFYDIFEVHKLHSPNLSIIRLPFSCCFVLVRARKRIVVFYMQLPNDEKYHVLSNSCHDTLRNSKYLKQHTEDINHFFLFKSKNKKHRYSKYTHTDMGSIRFKFSKAVLYALSDDRSSPSICIIIPFLVFVS